MLLVSKPGGFRSYWSGTDWGNGQTDQSQLVSALELIVGELSPFLNNCSPETDCALPTRQEAKDAVQSGAAALLVMPNWLQADTGYEDKVETAAFPGTADSFLFTTDVFAVPLPAVGAGAEPGLSWLDVVLDANTQAAFARAKGASPAATEAYAVPGTELERPGPLVPSLESRLPVGIDSTTLRLELYEWGLTGFNDVNRLVDFMAVQFKQAEADNTLLRPSTFQPGCRQVVCE
jgi:hypothetical protein